MSQFISLPTAEDMTERYRDYRETILGNSYKNQNILPICETFDKSYFTTLLGQSGCTAVRVYYGMDEYYKVHAIVVAVDSEDEDILAAEDAVKIIEDSRRCPDDCPPSSPLNS